MHKKRIIGIIIVKNGIVVQSINFNKYLPVGSIPIALQYLDNWGIDEIVIIDIDATRYGTKSILENLDLHSRNCFVPITYAGGLADIDSVRMAFKKGADKVMFNHSFISDPSLIQNTIKIFGSQSTIVSIDFVKNDNEYYVYNYLDGNRSNQSVKNLVDRAIDLEVGEILLNSVDNDGRYNGFEHRVLDELGDVQVPLILAGGAREADHFTKVFKKYNIDALAAGNMFNFVEHSAIKLKASMGLPDLRYDSYVNYRRQKLYDDQRLEKHDDEYLSELLYVKLLDRKI